MAPERQEISEAAYNCLRFIALRQFPGYSAEKQAWQTLGLRWQRYRFWEVGSWSFWERILKRASYRQNSIDLQGGPLRYLSGYWTAHVCEETIWGWRKKESPEMIREIGTSTYQGPGVVFASSQNERPHNSPESTQESLQKDLTSAMGHNKPQTKTYPFPT